MHYITKDGGGHRRSTDKSTENENIPTCLKNSLSFSGLHSTKPTRSNRTCCPLSDPPLIKSVKSLKREYQELKILNNKPTTFKECSTSPGYYLKRFNINSKQAETKQK